MPEPVAWMVQYRKNRPRFLETDEHLDHYREVGYRITPLYTADAATEARTAERKALEDVLASIYTVSIGSGNPTSAYLLDVLASIQTVVSAALHAGPACGTCGGSGSTRHEGFDGGGSIGEVVEDCPDCQEGA